MKLTPKIKKWLAALSLVILSAYCVTTPINLRQWLPEFVTKPYFMGISLVVVAGIVGLFSAYWIIAKQTE